MPDARQIAIDFSDDDAPMAPTATPSPAKRVQQRLDSSSEDDDGPPPPSHNAAAARAGGLGAVPHSVRAAATAPSAHGRLSKPSTPATPTTPVLRKRAADAGASTQSPARSSRRSAQARAPARAHMFRTPSPQRRSSRARAVRPQEAALAKMMRRKINGNADGDSDTSADNDDADKAGPSTSAGRRRRRTDGKSWISDNGRTSSRPSLHRGSLELQVAAYEHLAFATSRVVVRA